MTRTTFALALALLATSAVAQSPPTSSAPSPGTPTEQLAKPPADAKVWAVTSAGGAARHGQVSLWTDASGAHWSRYSLNLRGFMTEVDEQNRFASDGTLQSMMIRGHTPGGDAAESCDVKDGNYAWTSPVDHSSGKARPGLDYVAFGGSFDSFSFILDDLMKSPNHSVDLLPSGRAQLEPLTTLTGSNGSETKTLTAYALTGFGLSPFPIWMDGNKLFGVAQGLDFLPEGWAKVGPDLSKAQDGALAKRAPELVAKIAKTPAGPVAFQNVSSSTTPMRSDSARA